MHALRLLFYNIFLRVFKALILVASQWNPKAKRWIEGRKNQFKILASKFEGISDPVIWFHCASLGEFEQGRPLLETWKKQHPQHKILLTFFSASGYEAQKNFKGADIVFYLPMDGFQNAKKFLNIVNPSLVFWVKYDYWYYYLKVLEQRKIPVLLVSSIFWETMFFFKWYGKLHRMMLESFTHIFVQNEISVRLLENCGFKGKVTLAGDTRFDRVFSIASQFSPIEPIEAFCGTDPVIVAGSTWPEDDLMLDHYANKHPSIKFIIAPHDIHDYRIKDIEKLFQKIIRYSAWIELKEEERKESDANTLLIDNIGMLSKLYRYATIAYVGGGFTDTGVHNVLEAAVYGKPVIWGQEYERFHEAIGLLQAGGGFSIESAVELEQLLDRFFIDDEFRIATAKISERFVRERTGATQKIMDYIQLNRLFNN